MLLGLNLIIENKARQRIDWDGWFTRKRKRNDLNMTSASILGSCWLPVVSIESTNSIKMGNI